MSNARQSANRVRNLRDARGWTQAELAARASISRAAVSAIEIDRLVPSVAAALGLAQALGCTVEDLFGWADADKATRTWAWQPAHENCRFWQAEVNGRIWLYPADARTSGIAAHDGVCSTRALTFKGADRSADTLVLASCDPAAHLLAAELAQAGIRLLVLSRSSRNALELLKRGVVHAAGIHFSSSADPEQNLKVARQTIGRSLKLLHVVQWDEGIAVAPQISSRSPRSVIRASLRWIGREPGSAAKLCQDELLAGRPTPRRTAFDHRGVAEAIRCGWAEAGVCLRLVSSEAGLNFLSVRQEAYEICFMAESAADRRLGALQKAVQSNSFRQLLNDLPGFDASRAGEWIA